MEHDAKVGVTRETKIGLLVGLAFIVLFGVVISGSAERGKAVPLTDLRVPIPASPTTPTEPMLGSERLHESSMRQQIAAANTQQDLTRAAQPAEDDAVLSRGPSRLDQPVTPAPVDDRLADAGSTRLREVAVDTVRPPVADDAALGPALAGGAQPGRIPLAATPVAPPAPTDLEPIAPLAPAAVTYTVKPGDNWTKITRSQWGEQYAGQWKKIFEANKSVCPDEKKLMPGMVLTIPARPDGQPARGTPDTAPPAGAGTGETAVAGGATPPSDERTVVDVQTRFYTIQKGDSLYKIAEKELGNKGLYKAIYELNKDSMKSPDDLHVGMRVRLPVLAAPATQPARGSAPAAPARRPSRGTTT